MTDPNGSHRAIPTADSPHDNVAPLTKPYSTELHASISQKAARTLKKVADTAQNDYEVEQTNKEKCLAFEAMEEERRQKKFDLISPNKYNHMEQKKASIITIGSYVFVEPDLSPGIKSYGGKGWVRDVDRVGRDIVYEIAYLETEAAKVERNVPLRRVVPSVAPQQLAQIGDYQITTRTKTKTIPVKKKEKSSSRP